LATIDPSRRTPVSSPHAESLLQARHALGAVVDRLETAIVGQRPMLEKLVVALLGGGHVLIEGVPGLAKTRTVRLLSQVLNLDFKRIQFTPDLLPADLTGTQIFRPSTGTFDVRPGPIVTSILLADEINRAPAKVQSALLEAMQEGRITVGDQTIILPDLFWVLATQNPIEHEGTYPLPEAQLDRFLMKLLVTYPDRSAELEMLNLPSVNSPRPFEEPQAQSMPILNAADVLRFRDLAASIRVADAVRGYLVDLVRATRDPASQGLDLGPMIEMGASPRGTIALLRCARAHALLAGRDFVTPHDVKSLAKDVLRHRLILSFEADAEGLTVDAILNRILDHVPVP